MALDGLGVDPVLLCHSDLRRGFIKAKGQRDDHTFKNTCRGDDEERLDTPIPPAALVPFGHGDDGIESSMMAASSSDVGGLLGTSRPALERELHSLH